MFRPTNELYTVKTVDGTKYRFFKYPTSKGLKLAGDWSLSLVEPLIDLIMKSENPDNIDVSKLVQNLHANLRWHDKVDQISHIIEEYVKTETQKDIIFDDYFRGGYSHALKVFYTSLMVNFDFLQDLTRLLSEEGGMFAKILSKNTASTHASNESSPLASQQSTRSSTDGPLHN